MKIGIYDPYLDSLSGGEKYMLTAASCLSLFQDNEVSVFWNDASILEKAHDKLNINLERVKTVPNFFTPKISTMKRLDETIRYDRIIALSDGSIPFSLARETYLHFQFPVEWINGKSLINKIKIRRIKAVICNSKFTKKFIDKEFGIKSIVIYPPCGDFSEQTQNNKKRNIILTVGRYSLLPEGGSFKKQEVMIQTFKQMIDNGLKDWEFYLAISFFHDNRVLTEQLEEATKGYPIKIIRNANYQQITKLYELAKIYWHAAGFGENTDKYPERTEHFGITTVEAMHKGAIPVVINAGGQPEIVTDNNDGFLWDTREELIQKTQKLIKNEKIREKMAQVAKDRARQFSNEKFCQKLQEIIL